MTGFGPEKFGRFRSARWQAWLPVAAAVLWLAGCTCIPVRPDTLQVAIVPDTITPGAVVTVRVLAPPGTTEVKGRLDLPGSPVLPLKSKDNGRTWTFTTQIPIDAVWNPGKYRVVVQGKGPDGPELQGQAWITAQ